jgi:hypothetical protein
MPLEHLRNPLVAQTGACLHTFEMELTWRGFCAILFAVSLLLAGAGVLWYALTPNVASYQVSSLLVLPAFVMVLVWLHHRLPMRVQWVAASALALVGPVGYLIFGGSQWWNWGQLTPLPLILLAIARDPDTEGDFAAGPVGPFGPP